MKNVGCFTGDSGTIWFSIDRGIQFDVSRNLSPAEQYLHLAAIGLVVTAVALVMSPAALHRQTSPQAVSNHFIQIASRSLLMSMFPLLLGISFDFYLISRLILNNPTISLVMSATLVVVFATLWFLLPRARRLQNIALWKF